MRCRALLAALSLFGAPALAEERIHAFDGRIAVQKDGSVDVMETIDVTAEGNAIRHGIFRDFPTRYTGRRGEVMHVGFTLLGTSLDGVPEPAATETIARGVRIKIGSAEKDVTEGEHRYTIHYRATREVGRFEGYDELYWNVTGNGWRFPIDSASATITLPEPVRFGERAAYTGAEGSTGSAASVTAEAPGSISFATTGPLGPYEGLTVAAAFPQGVVTPLSSDERAASWLADHGPPLAGIAGLLGLLTYLYYAYNRVGRDPRPGTVVPLFSPADGLTPAAMRYVTKMSVDNRGFAAALVDAAVRGQVRLSEEDGGWFGKDSRRIDRIDGPAPLGGPEGAMLSALAAPGYGIAMKQENHEEFSSAREALSDGFKQAYDGRLFHRNLGWAAAGLAVLGAALWVAAAAVLLADGDRSAAGMVVIASGMTLVAGLLFAVAAGSEGSGKWLFGGLAAVLGLGAAIVAAPQIPAAFATGNFVPLLIPMLGVPFVFASFFWISAPTREGRGVLDRIAGFKQYLSITEGRRFDRMMPPAETLETFEKYLPYAIALGVENRWAKRFEGQLAAAAAARTPGAYFGWYSGSRSPWSDAGGFAESLGSGLASTISTASSAPGSSSGSGGGGFSGGGGGGGGGGGW